MSKIAKVSDFDNDVTEYKMMEKKVATDFLQGVIKLGEILQRQRDKWKPEKRWQEYLDKVGKHLSGANQFIRLYEYSEKFAEKLVPSQVTNWNKLNMFLALPDDLKEKLSETLDGEDLSTDDFREKISKLKEDEDIPKTDILSDSDLAISDLELVDLIESSSLVDLHFMAKEVLKGLKKAGTDMSNYCLPIAEAFLSIEKAIRDLDDKNRKKLTMGEKKFWNKLLRAQAERLNKLLK